MSSSEKAPEGSHPRRGWKVVLWRLAVTPPRSRLWVLVAVIYMLGVQWLSSTPLRYLDSEGVGAVRSASTAVMRALPELWMNASHVPVFFGLAWCWCWALSAWPMSYRRLAAAAVVVSIAFSLLNELSQLWVDGRTADAMDLGLDTVGVVAAVTLFAPALRAVREGKQEAPAGCGRGAHG